MTLRRLVAHTSVSSMALEVTAGAELTERTLELEYRVQGDVARLAVPQRRQASRADALWEHTCFEAFVAPAAGPRYFELNFSPSTQWAAYAFDAYRRGMQPLSVARPPAIAVDATPRALTVTAGIEREAFAAAPWPWRIGLTAVIEDFTGARGYFALCHSRESPDFHDATGFTIVLDGSAR